MKNHCMGCGEEVETFYCEECSKNQQCPHDNNPAECDDCHQESDFGHGVNRERGKL